ncbi:CapA family protein [Roseomonas haemaphysalidis]|uniref:CapA family protein n=1 Tax=Roseomonas haemaphysalidis TaxID=2768162 RepID=A0ABS3KNN4_9PROT|nr:CapA family protein [Roseomonas haemaphysalidis]MBO1079032.1 CapA family protein [Roseomonas haemaphysalidis]
MLRLALTGDSILQRRLLSCSDPQVAPLFDMIRGADMAFTNLEVLANDFRGDPALESGGSHFGAPAWVLDELAEGGFDLFATATNHCLDYSISGLLHSMAALDARGLTYAGIGRNLEDARRPAYHEHPNGTVALLSCSSTFAKGQEASQQRPDMPGRPGLNPLRFDTMHEVTEQQLETLKQIATGLGLEQFRQMVIKLGFGHPPEDPAVFPFGPLNFKAAAETRLRTTPNNKDMAGIARWVREARALADVVLVSLHAHEQDGDKEIPAAFIPEFAHRMIDEGADLVVGHGPHLLRGMEIYKGKPIFYSLGNFIGQNELVSRLPADSYDRFKADPEMTPGQVYRQRTADDTKGFPAERKFWETVVPVCLFDNGRLAGMEIHPVSLGLGDARHRRGRPRLAAGEEGAAILRRFAALSEPFGTRFTERDGIATLSLPG